MGYGATFAFAGAGLVATVIALAGVLYARWDRNPADAINGPGVISLLYIYPLSMAAASSFSSRSSDTVRRVLRIFVRANFIASIAGEVIAVVLLSSTHRGNLVIPTGFAIAASVCQISALVWLFRYSREVEA